GEAPTGPAPSAIARLYVGVGSRDGIRPGDLVGAIAGEANIPGSAVGRIEIRDTFSIVEVQADAAEKVIRAVNGTTIKGRSVRVDYDRAGDRARKPGGPRGPGGAGGGGPRGPGGPGGRRMVRRPPQQRD
ncbi:MAG: DbpA RNA binding domain-containing protein, partial [Gemmatimonadota bacterium]